MTRPAWLRLKRFATAKRGAALVEFAFIAPVLSAMAVGVLQYGGMIIAYQQMHNGIDSGALYVMRGGAGASTIHDVALGAWSNPPADASVSVSQNCTCAGVTSSCSSLCSDGSYPQAFATISASGTYAGTFGSQSLSASQTVRTQ